MPTDLFVAASGWPSSALADVVPPACRRDVEAAPAPRRDGDDAVVELPAWRPRQAARHLVPAFSGLHPAPASFRFEVSLERAGRWSTWVAGATIGEARFAPLGGAAPGARPGGEQVGPGAPPAPPRGGPPRRGRLPLEIPRLADGGVVSREGPARDRLRQVRRRRA